MRITPVTRVLEAYLSSQNNSKEHKRENFRKLRTGSFPKNEKLGTWVDIRV